MSLCHIGDGCQLDDEGGSCPNHPSIAISASLTPAVDTSRMEDQQHEEEEEEEGESTRQEIVEQVNIDVQEAIAGVEVGVGVVILGSAAQSEYGEVLMQTNSCCDHQQDLVMSYECPTDASATNGIAAASAAGEDKKLQYALRSNPKRSRRFFDPDYALELVSPSAPSATATTTTISSVITAAAATVAPPAAAAGATAAAAASPAASAPIKKMNSLFSEKARACTECGKQFPSWKALFGHMRCHPERQWRGIQPPNSLAIARDKPFIKEGNADNSTSQQQHNAIAKAPGVTAAATKWPSLWESESENSRALSHLDDSVDESDTESIEAAYMNGRDQESLKRHNWMRGKRSKRSVQDVVSGQFSESGTPPEEVMDERDMADCLVMLAFAAKSKADEPSDCDSGQEGLDWEGHSRPPRAAETREKMKEKKSYGCVQKSILFLAREGKAEKWEEDHEKVSWERKSKFECSTCKKTFRSHQALGGHRASHKKVKGCFARTNATEEVALQEVAEMTTTMMTMMEQQEEEPDDAAKKRPEKEEGPPLEDMSMGRFLQCSITCSEKMEEDQYDSAMAMERKKLKHQTSSCSSSSSIMAVTAAAGTLLMHHHQHQQQQQQQQQPKVHQCTICHRVFATGQALGGHKRCHWGGSAAPESSKKGTPKQDGDGGGGGCAPLQACLGISTSERSTELSKKARQDSASFASAQAWMNVSEVTDKASEQLSELSRKGRQDSISEDDTKGVHAYAQNWLGAYVSSDKMVLGARCCDDNDDDDGGDGSGGGGGVPAHKGWFEGFSSNSEISKRLTGGKETGSVDAGAEAWFGSCVSEKGCESSIYVHHHQPSCYGSGGVSTEAEQQVALYNAGPPKEELLDLNLPAPVEDAEDGAFSATPLKPADAAHHQQLSPSPHPPRSCFTFLGPAAAAPNWFHEEGRAAADA